MEAVSGMLGYWEEDTSQMSHGEGFLTVFSTMFREPGLYLMDEPEAALSFTSFLRLVALMQQLGGVGAQVVCATHSPILAATPGAEIIEIGDHGFRKVPWDKLELVDLWRRYLNAPDSYLRHITDSMNTAEADAHFATWMCGNLNRAADHFDLVVTGAPVFGWRLRSIGAPAEGSEGARWLRVLSQEPQWAQGEPWTGPLDANIVANIPKPRVLDVFEWAELDWRHQRAEVMTLMPGVPCSPTDVLHSYPASPKHG